MAAQSRVADPSCVPPLSRGANTAADDRARWRRAHARMQCEEQLGRCSIGPVDGEAPADLVGVGADLGAMARHQSLIFGAPGFRTPSGDRLAAFRLDELDAA